jgi:hypothetical protein
VEKKNGKPKTSYIFDLAILRSALSDQESNLDSSDPESDVLPVTPSDKVGVGVSVMEVWVWGSGVVQECVYFMCVWV